MSVIIFSSAFVSKDYQNGEKMFIWCTEKQNWEVYGHFSFNKLLDCVKSKSHSNKVGTHMESIYNTVENNTPWSKAFNLPREHGLHLKAYT